MVFLLLVIIIIRFFRRVFSECTEAVATSLIPLVTNFSGICALQLSLTLLCGLKSPRKKYGNSKRMLTKFVSIGSYSTEVRTFRTLITSTKLFSLIISKTLCQNDPLPRYVRLCT